MRAGLIPCHIGAARCRRQVKVLGGALWSANVEDGQTQTDLVVLEDARLDVGGEEDSDRARYQRRELLVLEHVHRLVVAQHCIACQHCGARHAKVSTVSRTAGCTVQRRKGVRSACRRRLARTPDLRRTFGTASCAAAASKKVCKTPSYQ